MLWCGHALILGPDTVKALLRLSTVFTSCRVGAEPSAAFNEHMGISRPAKGELDEANDQGIDQNISQNINQSIDPP
jgi:hypothetical protein